MGIIYNEGTVSVTGASATVIGAGTLWNDAISPGYTFYGPDHQAYPILARPSDTEITLATPYRGSTAAGQAYYIQPTIAIAVDLANQTNDLLDSYQTGAFKVGAAASPGWAVFGDLDTGLYSPGADQLAISTGGVSRLYIGDNGWLGLGTDSPDGPLHLAGNSTYITLEDFDNNDKWYLTHSAGNDGDFEITSQVDGGAYNIQFVIRHDGNVGIGTTPLAKLHVGGDIRADGDFVSAWVAGADPFYGMKFQTSYSLGVQAFEATRALRLEAQAADSSGKIEFFTGVGPSHVATINSSGFFGIGTETPSRPLEVCADGATLRLSRKTAPTGAYTELSNNANGDYITNIDPAGAGTSQDYFVQIQGQTIIRARQNDIRFPYSGDVSIYPRIATDGAGSLHLGADQENNAVGSKITFGCDGVEVGEASLTGWGFGMNPAATAQMAVAAGSSYIFVGRDAAGTNDQIRIEADGDCVNTNGVYGTLSDARLKENIHDAGSQWDDISRVRLRKYSLKGANGKKLLGVVAQELQAEGMGGLVDESADGILSVRTSVLFMKALGVIQELQERVESLEKSLGDLP